MFEPLIFLIKRVNDFIHQGNHINSLNPQLLLFFSYFIFLLQSLNAQQKIITVGLQYKPLIPSKFFRTGDINLSQNNVDYSISPKFSFSGGIVIRKGFTKNFSLESGINYVKRNYDLKVENKDISFSSKNNFSIIGYEVPTLGLIFVRLGEQIFMDAAFGMSLDFFPSDVGTLENYYQQNITIESITLRNRNRWIQSSLLANLGYEWRSQKNGYFYFGSSFHRPFAYSYLSNIKYIHGSLTERVSAEITGNYLTFDFRYFFHENPQKQKVKKQEKDVKYFEELKKRGNKMN